jgi:hypothetical protein
MDKTNRAVIILAAFDFESLQLTLNAIDQTLEKDEKVVLILNGRRCFKDQIVETIGRIWAAKNPNYRFVVRPLCSGREPYYAIKEVLENFDELKNVQFIAKIDDDLIPLKRGWLDELEDVFVNNNKNNDIGFVTSLINNNAWGFKKIVELYNKQDEYNQIMNYDSYHNLPKEVLKKGLISDGLDGTVWQYPYVAKWIHSWTSLEIPKFIEKTSNLNIEEIPLKTHYSIGCMYFEKKLWSSLEPIEEGTTFDEMLINKYCLKYRKRKISLLSQPMLHLFYFTQRVCNRDILPLIANSLSQYFDDDSFINIRYQTLEERIIELQEELTNKENSIKQYVFDNGLVGLRKKVVKKIFRK